MKFLIVFLKIIAWVFLIVAFMPLLVIASAGLRVILILAAIAFIVFLVVINRINKSKLPGGIKGSKLQGIWVLEKHLKFDPVMKKYQSLPVELKKNYFEFKNNQFRSGDFDEKQKQLPAEWSSFSIEGDIVIFESEFLKRGHWTWGLNNEKLELTGETINPEGKSQFIFYKKNWA